MLLFLMSAVGEMKFVRISRAWKFAESGHKAQAVFETADSLSTSLLRNSVPGSNLNFFKSFKGLQRDWSSIRLFSRDQRRLLQGISSKSLHSLLFRSLCRGCGGKKESALETGKDFLTPNYCPDDRVLMSMDMAIGKSWFTGLLLVQVD